MGHWFFRLLDMWTLILFCLFSVSFASSDVEQFSPQNFQDRNLCCVTARNNCVGYCAGRSCSSTCTVRCGIFMSNCGAVSCSSVAASTCVAATTASTVTTTTTTTTTTEACVSPGGDCLTGPVTTCCNRPTYDCRPGAIAGTGYCVAV